jgi:tripartite-type tricarboxylate transporter receptor subunit TctC
MSLPSPGSVTKSLGHDPATWRGVMSSPGPSLLRRVGALHSVHRPATPDTPTFDEAGVPGLHASFWHGLWAPKGTPKDVIASLHAAVVETLADPSVRQRLADLGQGIWPRGQQTPEALAAQQKAEIEKWWPIIKAANIKAE